MKVSIISFSFKRGLSEDATGNGNALRAEPGPPTARVTLFALDEANLPK